MRRFLSFAAALALVLATAFWWLTRPLPVPGGLTEGLQPDLARGEQVFRAAGCASCHVAPDADDDEQLVLSGGYRIESPFGTFLVPNISTSQQGIAGWSVEDLANALIAGVSPDGGHYYPSLPYASYVRMRTQDVVDLKAYLDTLPPSDTASLPHELGFPFSIRRGLGLWKRLNLDPAWVLADAGSPEIERGRYLVEALGHCGECHTPRDATGGLDRSRWLQGAPNPSGKGKIPGLTPDTLTWSARDIAYYLETGFDPDFDTAGGEMVKVIRNIAQLPPEDRSAIAAYIKSLPRRP